MPRSPDTREHDNQTAAVTEAGRIKVLVLCPWDEAPAPGASVQYDEEC